MRLRDSDSKLSAKYFYPKKLRTSAIVSGNFEPRVSGITIAKIPAIKLDTPMIISGRLPFIPAKIGAAIPPTLCIKTTS